MKMRVRLTHLFMLTALFAIALLCSAHPALAQANGSANASFSCSAGKASGPLYTSGLSCPKTMSFDNIFSFVVCNMEELSSNLMGNMFCGMITNLAPSVSALLVLAVFLFGVSFTIGLIPATAREFQLFLFKICFVWAFATQSDYLIGIGYAFFINGIRDGVAIALTNAQAAFSPGNTVTVPTSGSAIYAQLDAVVATFIHYATDYLGITKTAADAAGNPNQACQNALFAVMAIMAVAFPPVFYMALAMLGKICLTFLRAVFGYIYALVGIAFLMTLAPFFMSFFLFKQTRPFFDKWIGYLASFALQIILLFAFLSFILSINVSSITSSFSALVVRNVETKETTSFRAPWDYCTLCQFQQVSSGVSAASLTDPTAALDTNNIATQKLQCLQFAGTKNANGSVTFQQDPTTKAYVPVTSGGYPAPIGVLDAMSPVSKSQQGALLTFMSAGLLSLVILAYIVESLLGSISSLSQTLAGGLGGYSAPQLGGGQSLSGKPAIGIPFEGNIQDFSRGFERGYQSSNNSIGATTRAFKEGAKTLVSGTGNPADHETGFANRIVNFLGDPVKFRE